MWYTINRSCSSGKKGLYIIFFVALLAVATLSGCGSDNNSGESSSRVAGMAVLDEPVVGATVTVTTVEGKELYSESNETYTNGSFLLSYPGKLPDDYNIVVTGGTIGQGGPPMTETLRTEVRDHNHDRYGFYLVDPLSTLVAAYHQARPNLSYDEAVDAVWWYLQLSATVDAINDIHFLEEHFHSGVFMAAAREAGGLQAFNEYLVAQIDDPTAEAPCFTEDCSELPTGAATFIAGAVAEGALGYIGGEAAGYVMKEAFGWGEEPPNRQAEIIDMLSQQKEMLNNIISELGDLKDQLQDITVQLNNMEYNLKKSTLTSIIAFANEAYEQLYIIAATNPAEKDYKDMVSHLAERLAKRDLETDLATLHDTLVTDPTTHARGLLDIWGELQHARGYFVDVYPELASHATYWYDVQVKLLNLLVEHLHYKYPTNTTLAANARATFAARKAIQNNMFLTRVESLNFVAPLYYGKAGFPYADRLRQFCWGMFYSPQLDKADQQVGQMEQNEKSLIVRLYLNNYNYWLGTRLDNVTLQLRNNDTGEIYSALPVVNTYTIWTDTLRPTAEVGRYVFKNMPYGNYSIVDNNSQYKKMGVNWLLDSETLAQVISFTAAKPYTHLIAMAWDSYYLHGTYGCSSIAP
jgi:hypothetical protein